MSRMAEWWDETIRVTVRYITDYVLEFHDADRAGADEHIEDLINQFGLEQVEAKVYRDASGGLVLITETEVG